MSKDQLKAFFVPMVRKAFFELGLCEQAVTSYIAEMLSGFARSDHLYRLRGIDGRSLESVVEMVSEISGAARQPGSVEWEREARRYVADYALFMSGLFRTHVERGGYLSYYLEEGQRSYSRVSRLDLLLYRTGFYLFEELSKKFEYYSGALDYMRHAYFAPLPGQDPFKDFLQQVEGWVKVGISNN